MSSDGLFRVSPNNNKYYYESSKDQVELSVYVQTSSGRQPQQKSQTFGRGLFNLTLVDCGVHKSCVSCANSAHGECEWCGNKCLNPSEDRGSDECLRHDSSSRCPSFDTGTTKLLIPYTAHRQQAPLLFSLLNVPSAQANNLQCMFTLFNGRTLDGHRRNLTVPYQLHNASHATCQLATVFTVLSSLIEAYDGQIQTNLRLYDPTRGLFIDSVSNGKLALLFYKCEMKASDCGQCLGVNSQLSCMWCQQQQQTQTTTSSTSGTTLTPSRSTASCRFMNAQSKLAQVSQCISSHVMSRSNSSASSLYQCDKPQVDLIEPSKLPIGGGTVLAVYGNNLGTRASDILDVHVACPDQAGIKCEFLERKYVPSKQVWCETRASQVGVQSGCKVVIKLRANSSGGGNSNEYVYVTSSQLVDYVDPIINDIEPKQVIQSAKYVWLTISGVDLDAGRFRSIQIIDYASNSQSNDGTSATSDVTTQQPQTRTVKCEIKNSTARQIRCRLNEKFEQLGKKNLKLVYDKSMTVLNYLSLRVHADPLVKHVDTKHTFHAGGTAFRVHGYGFDHVQSMYTYVSYRNVWYSEPVQARARLSNELIEFDYPALNDAFFSLIARQQQQPASSTHKLEIGFLMDGFNVTLKDTLVEYRANPTPDQLSVTGVRMDMQSVQVVAASTSTSNGGFMLVADVHMDPSVYPLFYAGLIRDNFQVYVGCSLCTELEWTNQTRFTCRLPALNQKRKHPLFFNLIFCDLI